MDLEIELPIENVKQGFSGDIPIYKVTIPSHKLAHIPDLDNIIEQRVRRLGIQTTHCQKCLREIIFLPTTKGRSTPVTLAMKSHFADCPSANQFRKKYDKNSTTKRKGV